MWLETECEVHFCAKRNALGYNALGYNALGYNALGCNALGYNALGYNARCSTQEESCYLKGVLKS